MPESAPSFIPRLHLVAWILLFTASAFLFYERAAENGSRVNTQMNRTDQGAYADFILRMRVKNFKSQGDRNRMPLYPAMMALGVQKDWDRSRVFETGKVWNTWLALGSLAIIGTILFRSLPAHAAANALYLVAFTVFLFKAPHLQAEVLYYSLFFLCFAAGWRLFQRPSLWLAVVAGALAGLTHLTKASVAPAIFCFVVFHLLDTVWRGWRIGMPPLRWARRLAVPLLVIVAFLCVVWNYISESKRVYGHYFYNVNSTFYFWCESWEDAVNRTKAAGDRHGWPDLPPEEIPSAGNYLKRHGLGEVTARVGTGISSVWRSMRKSYGYFPFALALGGGCAFVLWRRRRLFWRWFRKRPMPALAVLSYFAGYYLLVAWYSQIISGNRFILGIFLPYVFTTLMILSRWGRGVEFRFLGKPIAFLPFFQTAFSVFLLLAIIRICTHTILVSYGGW